jgi:hypothetical protein
MLELIVLAVFLIAAIVVLKIITILFKVSFWALSLPLQFVAIVVALALGLLLVVPLGLLLGLLALPFLLISVLLPFILIGWGIYLLLRS